MSSLNDPTFATDPCFECLDKGTFSSAAHLFHNSVSCKHTNISSQISEPNPEPSGGGGSSGAGPVVSQQDLLSYLLSVGSGNAAEF